MANKTTIAEVEDLCAARLADKVAEEVRLRSFLDLSPSQYYLGTTFRSAMVRVSIAMLALFLFVGWYPSDQNLIWPILGFIALNEIVRMNTRIDALNRLVQIYSSSDAESLRSKLAVGGAPERYRLGLEPGREREV